MRTTWGIFEDSSTFRGAFLVEKNMALLFNIATLITSAFTLVITLILTFAEEDANIHKFFGDKEIIICIAISIVFMLISISFDRR